MSSFENYEIDLLKKKNKFFSDIFGEFDKSELSKYRSAYNKFWSKLNRLADFQKEIDELRAEGNLTQKFNRKMRLWFFASIIVISASNYFFDRSSIEGGLFIFSLMAFFGWISIVSHISETARMADISNINRFVLLLRSDLFEYQFVDFYDAEQYLKIMQGKGFSSATLTEAEQHTISKVNIDLNISIADSMGYNIPTFFDSFDLESKKSS